MRKTKYAIELSDSAISILQLGFFNNEILSRIEVPKSHSSDLINCLETLIDQRNLKTKKSGYLIFPLIQCQFKISDEKVIRISEGCGNNGNSDDAFAIYDEHPDPWKNWHDGTSKTVVVKFELLNELIELIKKQNHER